MINITGIIIFNILFFVFLISISIISMFENMSKKGKTILLVNLLVAILAISIQFIIIGFYLNTLPIYIVIFSNVSLIAYFLLSIYSLTKTTQLEVTSLNLEQEKENNNHCRNCGGRAHCRWCNYCIFRFRPRYSYQ